MGRDEAVVMRALTIWQPWASLVMAGVKPYEFRGSHWRTYVNAPKFGERIGIHAGMRRIVRTEVHDLVARLRGVQAWTTCLKPEALGLLERVLASPEILPLGHMLGTAVLTEAMPAWQIVGEFGGAIADSDRAAHSNFAWRLSGVEPFEPPIEAKGAQGFWNWTP